MGGSEVARRRRRFLFGLVIAGVLLAGQELLFRVLFPLPEVMSFNRIHYQMLAGAHPRLRETLKRGLVYDQLLLQSQPDGFREVHKLNLYGFRGPDFAIDPSRGHRRIVVIGDSVVEGQGAAQSSTIASELYRLAATEGQSDEVINLGVIAASLPHLALLVRDAVGLLSPAIVIVVLYANDLPSPPYPAELERPGPRFSRRDAPLWLPRAAELFGRMVRDEPIYRRWPHRPLPFFAPVPDPSNPWTGSPGPPPGLDPALYAAMVAGTINPWLKEQSEAIAGMLAHDFSRRGSPVRFLKRIKDLCRPRGVDLVVAYVPFCGTVHPRYADTLVKLGMQPETAQALARDPLYRRQNRHLAELCTVLDLPLADATDDLVQAEQAGAPQYWEWDSHPRPAGYATIARRIHRALPRSSR
jgi:lysophospholipase L1-like esterase